MRLTKRLAWVALTAAVLLALPVAHWIQLRATGD